MGARLAGSVASCMQTSWCPSDWQRIVDRKVGARESKKLEARYEVGGVWPFRSSLEA